MFDYLASPANAFGIMDSGHDLALSRAFVVDSDIWGLTNAVQNVLRDRHRGHHHLACARRSALTHSHHVQPAHMHYPHRHSDDAHARGRLLEPQPRIQVHVEIS
ncbi:hypothetical protein OBBRIDRAFT_851522 [Obba rivulosa]|uniref:Uncharacterized protein n=1 Tax=Obba rivulosa TaxID=1052685 RepID=A0A8E2AM79_9APHY|nr:hypothetical protein OBBRIDRAFT_851522 [Obba rivulosa]